MLKLVRRPSKRTAWTRAVLALSVFLPGLLGGCPEFRNSAVDALHTATRSILFCEAQPPEAAETAARNILTAALDLLFDQLRANETR